MTRVAKLYKRLSDGRTISFAEFEQLLHAFGFELDRVRGSHRIFKHRSLPARITTQPRAKDAKPYQLRQFLDTIEQFGLVLDEDDE